MKPALCHRHLSTFVLPVPLLLCFGTSPSSAQTVPGETPPSGSGATKPEIIVQVNHAFPIENLAISPDGRWLVSVCPQDYTLKLWEVSTGRQLRTFGGNVKEPTRLALSPDGKLLAVGSRDNTIKLVDVTTGREIRTLAGHSDASGGIDTLSFSPDGRLLASGAGEPTIKFWDPLTGSEIRTLRGHAPSRFIFDIAFSPDGRLLASASGDGTVGLWTVATGKAEEFLKGHEGLVTDVAFSPDGRWLVSGSDDGTTRLWDAHTGDLLATLISLAESPDWLVTTPDGFFDGSGVARDQLVLWRLEENTLNVAPSETYSKKFYRSGLLAHILAGKGLKATQKERHKSPQ